MSMTLDENITFEPDNPTVVLVPMALLFPLLNMLQTLNAIKGAQTSGSIMPTALRILMTDFEKIHDSMQLNPREVNTDNCDHSSCDNVSGLRGYETSPQLFRLSRHRCLSEKNVVLNWTSLLLRSDRINVSVGIRDDRKRISQRDWRG